MMRLGRFLLLFIALSSAAVCALPDPALADVQAILACRQLPSGPARANCLEGATADLEQGRGGPAASGLVRDQQAHGTPQSSRTTSRGRFTAGVEGITYQDGRPVFQLDNGQTWYSMDRRRLTFKRGHSYATIEKTPVGMLLHYNGSFFALRVEPKQG